MANGDQPYMNMHGKHFQGPSVDDDPRKQEYLRWLCTPPKEREPSTKTEFAKLIGLSSPRMLQRWENDIEFLKAWEKHYLKTIGSPERKSEIMETLFRTATDPDDPKHVAAAKEYFAIEGSLKPQQMQVNVTKDANELTDEAIEAMIAAHAEAEARKRMVESQDDQSESA